MVSVLASNFYAQIALVGACQGFTLAAVVYSIRREPRIANLLLTALLCVVSTRSLLWYFLHEGFFMHFREVYALLMLGVAAGPLLYLYVKALTQARFRFQKQHFALFIPVLLMVVLALVPQLRRAGGFAIEQWYVRQQPIMYGLGLFLPMAASSIILLFSMLAGHQLHQHKAVILQNFSNLENKSLHWLWWVIALFVFSGFSELILQLLDIFFQYEWLEHSRISLIAATISMFVVAIMGLKQPVIFQEKTAAKPSISEEGSPPSQDQEPKVSYHKNGLQSEQLKVYWQKLQVYMREQQPFLQPDLNLKALASMLNMSANHLSEVINSQSGQHFFDFVNAYRIAYAKAILERQNYRSLLEVALDAGFSSQAAFSTRFKKNTGHTPSQFARLSKNK